MQNELWNHALALYRQPGVEAACLALQGAGADVCLLLCGTWLQARRVAPDAMRAAALQAIAGPWQQQVIAPLRVLRQQWREAAQGDAQLASLREQVKGLSWKRSARCWRVCRRVRGNGLRTRAARQAIGCNGWCPSKPVATTR